MKSKRSVVTLNKNKQFRSLYSKGLSFVSADLITYVRKNYTKVIRIGITASKKVGIAVKRNRARRIIRSSYISLLPFLKGGFDLVFVARSRTCSLKTQDIVRSMSKHLSKAGVLYEKDRH